MFTVWYFDADPIGHTPEHVVTSDSHGAVMEAVQDRFSWDLFPDYGPFCDKLAKPGAGFVWELPADSRLAVIIH